MRFRLGGIFLSVLGVIALFWYVGLYRRPQPPPAVSQTPALLRKPTRPTTALAAPTATPQPTAVQETCPRDSADNGMLRLSVLSVLITKQIGPWTLDLDHRFVVVEVLLEAITDFQLASSAVFWAEEPDGTERTRSVATGALARPLGSLSPWRGERVRGEIAFEIGAQTKELKLHYDPFLARRLVLCVSVP